MDTRNPASAEKGNKVVVDKIVVDKIVVGKELINDCVRYAPALDILYLNNPKCGCTTVKHALWLACDARAGRNTFRGNVHDRKADPFARNVFRLPDRKDGKIAQAVVFSAVRNPFARALSAYVDKVANDPVVWPIFLKRFGLRPTVGRRELSFTDFLGLIAVADDDILDGHFRPQCRNLLLPLAKPLFVGFVEDMAPVGAFLQAHGIPFRNARMNATRALDELSTLYDDRAVALVRTRYADDFANFGYSTRLADIRARPCPLAPSNTDAGEDPLLRWLATGRAPRGFAAESRSPFVAFNRSRNRDEKARIVRRRVFDSEHDWYRLERYREFAIGKVQDRNLAEAIRARMASLRQRYRESVSNPDIFVDFPAAR